MITTSLELSKQLKEAGYPEGESHFYYEIDGKDSRKVCRYSGELGRNVDLFYSAPTAEEILEKLPKEIEKDRTRYVLQIFWYTHEDGGPCVRYVSDMGTDYWDEYPEYGVIGDTLTESLGVMYLHLKEHNLLPLA